MNRLEALSTLLLFAIPVLFLLISFYMKSLGFFFYSLPGAVAPGLTTYVIAKQKT